MQISSQLQTRSKVSTCWKRKYPASYCKYKPSCIFLLLTNHGSAQRPKSKARFQNWVKRRIKKVGWLVRLRGRAQFGFWSGQGDRIWDRGLSLITTPSATAQLQVREGDLTLLLDEKPKVNIRNGTTVCLLTRWIYSLRCCMSSKGTLNFFPSLRPPPTRHHIVLPQPPR